jgi:hypothetical protein
MFQACVTSNFRICLEMICPQPQIWRLLDFGNRRGGKLSSWVILIYWKTIRNYFLFISDATQAIGWCDGWFQPRWMIRTKNGKWIICEILINGGGIVWYPFFIFSLLADARKSFSFFFLSYWYWFATTPCIFLSLCGFLRVHLLSIHRPFINFKLIYFCLLFYRISFTVKKDKYCEPT